MKRIILPLAAIAISAVAASEVISCVSASYTQGEIGERIVLITDAGRVHDKSFNQSSYEAVLRYSEQAPYTDEEHGTKHGGFNFKERGLTAVNNYIEPLTQDSFSFISAYKIAVIKGTDLLVLPGFMHESTVDQAAELLGPDKTVIFADNDGGTAPNIINLVYNSQLAGFAAAWDTAFWATTKIPDPSNPEKMKLQGDVYNHGYVSFGTFGGISSKLAVDNFMWGLMVAIRYWNLRIDEEAKKDPSQNDRRIYFANTGRKGLIEKADNIDYTNPNYYSGSFEPGGSIKSGTVNTLVQNQADIIFPVAGPQTADVLSTAPKALLIGVDTDQSLQYSSSADRFVTSAIKNLVQSIADAIDHSRANRNNWNEDGSVKDHPIVGGEYWEGGVAPAQLNWSISIDKKNNPDSVGTKIEESLIDYENKKWIESGFVEDLNNFYLNEAGDKITEYMSTSTIEKIAKRIFEKYNYLLPLKFEDQK